VADPSRSGVNYGDKQLTDLPIHCILLTSFDAEFKFLANIFGLIGIRVHHAETLEQADFLLTVTGSTVLLSDVVFQEGSWQDALGVLTSFHPFVTMLVIADPVDTPFLQELFVRGACGVLWKPVEVSEARRLIHAVHEASRERRFLNHL
jgi:DNA-binding NtrC family response regulator